MTPHHSDAASSALAAVAQKVPSAVIVTAHLSGMTLQDWVSAVGIAFIALQAAYLIWKWRREARHP